MVLSDSWLLTVAPGEIYRRIVAGELTLVEVRTEIARLEAATAALEAEAKALSVDSPT